MIDSIVPPRCAVYLVQGLLDITILAIVYFLKVLCLRKLISERNDRCVIDTAAALQIASGMLSGRLGCESPALQPDSFASSRIPGAGRARHAACQGRPLGGAVERSLAGAVAASAGLCLRHDHGWGPKSLGFSFDDVSSGWCLQQHAKTLQGQHPGGRKCCPQVKPLWGFISDAFPIFGYRRRSYLIIVNLIGELDLSLLSDCAGRLVASVDWGSSANPCQGAQSVCCGLRDLRYC